MTDNEIIELLNECDTTHIKIQCVESILNDTRDVTHLDLSKIVDILNRQKAEIERLERHTEMYHEVRAEAVKEFAERLKEYVESYDVTTGYKIIIVNAVEEETIDNLVKEMVGEG